MLTTSSAFKEKVNADVRQSYGLVVIDFLNHWEYPFATVAATSTAIGYSAEQLCNGRFRYSDYVSSGLYIPQQLRSVETGWRGTAVSDENGLLDTPEEITIEYAQSVKALNYWVVGDEFNYPVDFEIRGYKGTSWFTIATVSGNTNPFYFYNGTRQDLDSFKLIVTRISAQGDSALLYETGAISTVVFEGDDLVYLDILEETQANAQSPFGNVSSNVANVSLINDKRWFSPTNQFSPFYRLLKPKIRIRPYIGI